MRRKNFPGLVFALIPGIALSASLALGQTQTEASPAMGAPKYDRKAEVTVDGTVEQVIGRITPRALTGIHLVLRTEKESLDVYLGPWWFLRANGFKVTDGDELRITGSKVRIDGAETLLARVMKLRDKRLVLRSKRGSPKWSSNGKKLY